MACNSSRNCGNVGANPSIIAVFPDGNIFCLPVAEQSQFAFINRRKIVSTENGPLSLNPLPKSWGRGQGEGVLASIQICDP